MFNILLEARPDAYPILDIHSNYTKRNPFLIDTPN